jgi:hypothetical protein
MICYHTRLHVELVGGENGYMATYIKQICVLRDFEAPLGPGAQAKLPGWLSPLSGPDYFTINKNDFKILVKSSNELLKQ